MRPSLGLTGGQAHDEPGARDSAREDVAKREIVGRCC